MPSVAKFDFDNRKLISAMGGIAALTSVLKEHRCDINYRTVESWNYRNAIPALWLARIQAVANVVGTGLNVGNFITNRKPKGRIGAPKKKPDTKNHVHNSGTKKNGKTKDQSPAIRRERSGEDDSVQDTATRQYFIPGS